MELFGGMLESHVFQRATLMFVLVYTFSYFTIFRSWKGKNRFEAASCMISLLHSTTTATLSSRDFFELPWKLGATNTVYQNTTLDFSTAYFAVDMLHFLLFVPNDYLFMAHHIATSTYMLTCRHYNHGAMSVMTLLFLGEVTSPLQNIWTLARMAKDESPFARTLYIWLSPFFTVFFTLIRGCLGPYILYELGSFYLTGGADGVIPRPLAWAWMLKVTIAVSGSGLWVYKLWRGLIKFYSNSAKGKPAKLD
eukprot:TRINITY_DN3495_c0_g1_i1.p1 TRINITY_DN3495_c0_g1~~TRINITY_DN3495_c0_g1_i1.p1  ORF type:complete len:251 (-),score=21.89 TRINITY_DN3495_c0_g1_i1:1209-1961(-)